MRGQRKYSAFDVGLPALYIWVAFVVTFSSESLHCIFKPLVELITRQGGCYGTVTSR
jgi:hypothetical protein